MVKIFKTIETNRLIIRPIDLSDAKSYHEAEIRTANTMAPYWSWVNKNKSLSDIEDFLQDVEKVHQQDNPSAMYFGVFDKNENRFLGCLWYADINWFVPRFEIAYWQDINACGNGYMTEAVNALTHVTIKHYGAQRVEIKTFVTNPKSYKIPERLNFNKEAKLKNYFIDFVTQDVLDGFCYTCCIANQLPFLDLNIK